MMVKRKQDGAVDESSEDQKIRKSDATVRDCSYITCEKSEGLYLAEPGLMVYSYIHTYLTGPGKIGLICTSTGFHFLSVIVSESYTHAQPRNTKNFTKDSQVCFHRRLFTDAVKPEDAFLGPEGFNRTAWGTRLFQANGSLGPPCGL